MTCYIPMGVWLRAGGAPCDLLHTYGCVVEGGRGQLKHLKIQSEQMTKDDALPLTNRRSDP